MPSTAAPAVNLPDTGRRWKRTFSQRGFELVNGLPFVANDMAMHHLLAEHTVAEAPRLQVAWGRIRRASGDLFQLVQRTGETPDPYHLKRSSRRPIGMKWTP